MCLHRGMPSSSCEQHIVPVQDDGATNMPKAVKANIQQGNLHIFGFDIPLPIKGTGMFEVMYLDDTLRIFKSGASYAVQAREDRLT